MLESVMPLRAPASEGGGLMSRPSRTMNRFSPVHSLTRPSGPSMIASSYPAKIASDLARLEFTYPPLVLLAVGMAFGLWRCHDEIFIRTPFSRPSSPRYAPQGQAAIATLVGANICLLYTSDAADEEDSVDLG